MRSPFGPEGYSAAAEANSAHCWGEVSVLERAFWGVYIYLGRDVVGCDDE
jgi:hypothetical protein